MVCDLKEIEALPARLEALPQQHPPVGRGKIPPSKSLRRCAGQSADQPSAGEQSRLMKAIVTGMIASYPGRVLWDYGPVCAGLGAAGFRSLLSRRHGWQTLTRAGASTVNAAYAVEFLPRALGSLSPALAQRWRFRGMDGATYGMGTRSFADVLAQRGFVPERFRRNIIGKEYFAVPAQGAD